MNLVTFVSVSGEKNFYNETLGIGILAVGAPAMEGAITDTNHLYGNLINVSLTRLVRPAPCTLWVGNVAEAAAEYFYNGNRSKSDLFAFATPGTWRLNDGRQDF